MRSFDGLRRVWLEPRSTAQYYPLTHSVFWLQHRLWGNDPFGYHLVNVALHAVNATLVWRILAGLAVPGALLAGGLFALHPVHVESVAWVSELKNTLSGVFYLTALLVYLRFRRGDVRRWSLYGLSFALFVGAVLSKTVTASLPAAILLVAWWQQGRLEWRRDVLPLVPFLVIGASLGLVTPWLEVHSEGAAGLRYDLHGFERLLLAGRAVWFYLGTLAWPAHLSFIYPRWEIDATDAWQYLAPLGVVVLVVALWTLRGRLGRAPLTAFLFFVGTLTPALGFFDVFPFIFSFVADHFQYLASLGILGLAAAGAGWSFGRLAWRGRLALGTACGLCLLALAVQTRQETRTYRDPETLWRATLARNPSCWMCEHNLGVLLASRGRMDEAIDCYRRSLALYPHQAQPHYNIGIVLQRRGDFAGAVARYREAAAIEPQAFIYRALLAYNLGLQGHWAEAVEHYREAVALSPDHLESRTSFADALVQLGRLDEAIEQLREAVRIAPDDARVRQQLDRIVASRQRGAEG